MTDNNNPSGLLNHSNHRIDIKDEPRNVRVLFNGEVVANSFQALVMNESGYDPVLYFPGGDIRMDLLQPTNHTTHCPFKGDASYWRICQ